METEQVDAAKTPMEEKVFHSVRGQIIPIEREKRGVCFGKDHSNLGYRFSHGRGFRISTEKIWPAPSSE